MRAFGAMVVLGCGTLAIYARSRRPGRTEPREDRKGTFDVTLTPAAAEPLRYEIVPGSGYGELQGIGGTLHLSIEDDGTHRQELNYEI